MNSLIGLAVPSRRLAVLFGGVLLGLLAGCSEQGEEEASVREGQVRNGVLSYSASDFFKAGEGRPGGTLRASVMLDTATLDIHSIAHGNIQWLGRLIFDGLVYLDEKGNPSPWLASSWTISEDGRVYTFGLREDVTFSDGTPFNAEAVRVNLEHLRDPATMSPLAAAYIAPYVSGRVIDEYTFEATLREPYTPFLDVLAQSWLSMISPKQILEAPATIAEHPIGTGPFVVERYQRGQGLKLVRRADYNWAPPLIGHQGPAYLERIELDFVPESLIRFSTLLSGEYDLTLDAPPQNAVALRDNPQFSLHSRIRSGNPFRSLTFNVEKAPFDDVRVRRALAIGIDREGLAWISGFGEYVVKSDFLAANTRHYDPAQVGELAYDPDAAARLLDEAGWTGRDAEGFRTKDGQRLSAVLQISENPAFPSSVAVALQADVQKLGFDLQLRVLPVAELMEKRYAGDFQLLGGGYWHSNTPDGLFMLYHSGAIPTERLIGQNVGRLRDETLDALLSQARSSQNAEEQRSLYAQAQQRLTELVPAVPAYESHHLIAYNRDLKGVVFDTSHNTPILTTAWLDRGRP